MSPLTTILVLLLRFGTVRAGVWAISQSANSCNSQPGLFAAIFGAFQTVQTWAGQAENQLRSASSNTRHPEVQTIAEIIFGPNIWTTAGLSDQIADGYNGIVQMTPAGTNDPAQSPPLDGQQWMTQKTRLDLEIWCFGAQLIAATPGSPNALQGFNFLDIARRVRYVGDEDVLNKPGGNHLKSLKAAQQPTSSPNWLMNNLPPAPPQGNIPNVLSLSKYYLNNAQNRGTLKWDRFDSNFVSRAANPGVIQIAAPLAFAGWKPIDELRCMELEMLHELSHADYTLAATDNGVPNRESYLWQNVVRLQDHTNAENLAYFGLVVDLILNWHLTVNLDGTLRQIP